MMCCVFSAWMGTDLVATTQQPQFVVSDEQFAKATEFLGQLVAVRSVSHPTSPDYNMAHLREVACMLQEKLEGMGFDVSSISIEDSAPFIVAEWMVNPALPTMLLYAHYDVQPVDRSKWLTDPFIMQERDGRLYGRGASDDKAGIVSILTALETFLVAGIPFPVNVKLLFEGEEEYGSTHMTPLLEQYKEQLQADALIVLDGLNRDVHTGTLTSSTRGVVNVKLKVNALEKPIHSGIGCLAPDPARAIASLVHALNDPELLPALREDHQPLNDQEREILASSSQSAESYARDHGVIEGGELRGNPEVSIYERIVEEPSVSVVNLNCGQPNGGNSIQESATCTIGIRVTPGQDPNVISQHVVDHLKSQSVLYNLPIEINTDEKGAWAWKANLAGTFSKKYLAAMGENFSTYSAMPCGGALPLLREFQAAFPDMEMIVPGVEDPKTAAHSHNESQDISIFRNSINSLIAFLNKASE